MALIEMLMPKMGESVMEGTILEWLKEVGDTIEEDEAVLEVATDKVDTEIPSTHEGVLKEKLVASGDTVQVGSPIAIIATEADAESADAPASPAAAPEPTPAPVEAQEIEANIASIASTPAPQQETQAPAASWKLDQPATGRFYSPLVMNIARQEGIGMAELEYIPGSGSEGRVTKKDILNYLEARKAAEGGAAAPAQAPTQNNGQASTATPPPAPATPPEPPKPAEPSFQESVTPPVLATVVDSSENQKPAKEEEQETPAPAAPVEAPKPAAVKPEPKKVVTTEGGDEIIEMDRMRKMIATRMRESVDTAPHVTSFVEADMTEVVNWRKRVKREFQEKYGESLTYTPIFIEAIAKAIQDYPMINVQVADGKIIKKKEINIGMAVALPDGNLIVPVIHNADQLNIVGLTKKVNDLARRARNRQLKADDVSGGTYTMSNVGSFGNVMGTPIIVQPQVGIMAAGTIKKKPAVIETPGGDAISIRNLCFLSHSYDHRVVDGALGGMFVRRVADYLESFDAKRNF